MALKWSEALKQWNAHKKTINPAHVFALPRKGTPEHAEVVAIQNPVKKHLHELRAEHAAKKAAAAKAAAEAARSAEEDEEPDVPKSKEDKKREAVALRHAAAVRKHTKLMNMVATGKTGGALPGPKPGAAAAKKRTHREEIIKILEDMWK